MATEPKTRASKTAAAASAATTEKTATEAKKASEAVFGYPKFEVPEVMRSWAEQGLGQTREAYARMKTAAEEATDMMEGSMETSRESVRKAQFEALDLLKANTDATFELMRELLTVKSMSDVVQLNAAFARGRFEAVADYSKELQATINEAGAKASEPAKAIFEKALSATHKAA